jgi:hypothetical protein
MTFEIIIIKKTRIPYSISNSAGHCLRLEIKDGRVYLFKPRWVSKVRAQKFLESKSAWLERNLAKERKQIPLYPLAKTELPMFKKEIISRLNYFNQGYNFNWQRVSIRHQTTRWGSCSPKGTLSFNSRLANLPLELQDYIIVHELCHLKVPNHSPKFWKLVEKTLPDYLIRRRALRRYRLAVLF